jgi:carbon monoxide dehydrogenase subunit G
MGQGTRMLDVVELEGRRYELPVEITRWEPPFAVHLLIQGQSHRSTVKYEIEEVEGGVLLTRTIATRYTGLVSTMFGTAIHRAEEEKAAADLIRLKEQMESTLRPIGPTTQPAPASD